MKKYWQIILASTIFVCMATFAQSITPDMRNFLRLAVDKNGDQRGYTKEDIERYFNVSLTRQGKKYFSNRALPNNPNQSVFEYSTNKGNRYLTFYFEEPVETFEQSISKLRDYKSAWFEREQANGLPIYYFAGKNPSEYIKTRKLYIRIYECSDKPQDRCIRKAQLIFGQR
ncbi:hypothetical protein [Wohlfahrtiimonas larvae]|uniref:Uncharacterized protein n=1 Tax=Wohlfahrtiimonas larvae TaxID=1157986 RepID=A0ABP9MP36_9GAMM|nr:hypothetical protein [Wohlfahrtiimonas larvae]